MSSFGSHCEWQLVGSFMQLKILLFQRESEWAVWKITFWKNSDQTPDLLLMKLYRIFNFWKFNFLKGHFQFFPMLVTYMVIKPSSWQIIEELILFCLELPICHSDYSPCSFSCISSPRFVTCELVSKIATTVFIQ